MAARADSILDNAVIVPRTVEAAATVAIGEVVKDGDADHECAPIAAVTDKPVAVVVSLGKLAGAAGDEVMVALLTGGAVVPVRLGGTATRGFPAKYDTTAGRVGDATVSEATPSVTWSPGWFTQSGVAGDFVGLAIARHYLTE